MIWNICWGVKLKIYNLLYIKYLKYDDFGFNSRYMYW